jgi:hypothetical protein
MLMFVYSEAIKQQIRFTKQESLSTTRNAIRTAREAEETASNTLNRLGEQTGGYFARALAFADAWLQTAWPTPNYRLIRPRATTRELLMELRRFAGSIRASSSAFSTRLVDAG